RRGALHHRPVAHGGRWRRDLGLRDPQAERDTAGGAERPDRLAGRLRSGDRFPPELLAILTAATGYRRRLGPLVGEKAHILRSNSEQIIPTRSRTGNGLGSNTPLEWACPLRPVSGVEPMPSSVVGAIRRFPPMLALLLAAVLLAWFGSAAYGGRKSGNAE